jgi:hypothetical protein
MLAPLRAAAAAALPTIYFPGRKDEPFRRCDLSSLQASRLVPSVAKDASAAAALAGGLLGGGVADAAQTAPCISSVRERMRAGKMREEKR